MMTIGSGNGTISQAAGAGVQAGYSGMGMQTDSVSRNIQNQITSAQEKLQALNSNEDMTPEEKMKKKQEIQQEITSLNQQLRQHQIEQRRQQNSKTSSANESQGENRRTGASKSGKRGNGLSKASMQAMISADTSMKQAQVQGNVATEMKGRAGVLKAEIKQDGSTGGNTERKEAELADVEQKAMEATASQASTLADANQEMREAAKADQESTSKEEDTKAKEKAGKTDQAGKNGTTSEERTQSQEEYGMEGVATTETSETAARSVQYRPVDVRL